MTFVIYATDPQLRAGLRWPGNVSGSIPMPYLLDRFAYRLAGLWWTAIYSGLCRPQARDVSLARLSPGQPLTEYASSASPELLAARS